MYQLLARLNKDDVLAAPVSRGAFASQGRLDEAIASYREAIRINKDDDRAHNNLAWLLATCSDPRFRDIPQALQLAQQAVKLAPSDSALLEHLGCEPLPCWGLEEPRSRPWRNRGNFATAATASTGSSWPWPTGNWAKESKARKWYDQAVEWMEKNKPQDEELRRLPRGSDRTAGHQGYVEVRKRARRNRTGLVDRRKEAAGEVERQARREP